METSSNGGIHNDGTWRILSWSNIIISLVYQKYMKWHKNNKETNNINFLNTEILIVLIIILKWEKNDWTIFFSKPSLELSNFNWQ